MEQNARVRKILADGTAQVVVIRQSACSGDCHKCSGCGAAQETVMFVAQNPIDAKAGDLVRVESETAPVLKAAAVLYLLPLVLFIAGYIAGVVLWQTGIWLALGAFAVSIAAVIGYDRLVLNRKKTEYTITGIISRGKEENAL
jgi:sigma-E factor negative regulatory protein RseC